MRRLSLQGAPDNALCIIFFTFLPFYFFTFLLFTFKSKPGFLEEFSFVSVFSYIIR